MLLNEPILSVFELWHTEKYEGKNANSFFQKVGELAFHTTGDCWLVFYTEHFCVTLGCDGVKKYQLPFEFSNDKYEIWELGDEEWISEEETIFSGQRIHFVEEWIKGWRIKFDDFDMKLYTYDEQDDFIDIQEYFKRGWINKMAVGNHLLKRKCECGGSGELLVDERNDFAVRCSSCHKSTYFDMILKYQVDSWNLGDTPCVIDGLN